MYLHTILTIIYAIFFVYIPCVYINKSFLPYKWSEASILNGLIILNTIIWSSIMLYQTMS